jgi:serine protease Do
VVGRVPVGSKSRLLVVRDGKEISVNVTIGELAETEPRAATSEKPAPEQVTSRIGLAVEPVPEAFAERLGITGGVRVVAVEGPAEEAGILESDVITRINNLEVSGADGFAEITSKLPSGRSVPILIVRGQVPTFLALRVPD